MKNVLILGAGQSSPYLISYMLEQAEMFDWFITVGDKDFNLANERINRHPRGNAVEFDVNDEMLRKSLINKCDIVINFLAPVFQYQIALECLDMGKHCVTASYENPRTRDLHKDAMRKGIIILNEMGLDPGIDHIWAMSIIDKVRANNGIVTSILSYGSGLPAPESVTNPLKYAITWNPRNVAMAGESGAQYMENGKIKVLTQAQVFNRTWSVDVDGVGRLEAYPNRDSLIYIDVFNLKYIHTMIRGTLRYPGWSETWSQLVKLGMPNETMRIPHLNEISYAEFTEMFLPLNANGTKLDTRVANFLGINPTGKIMDNLRWLGLFTNEKIDSDPKTASEVLVNILKKKLILPDGGKDMVILIHDLDVEYPKENKKERIVSTMVEYGDPDGFTAIAKTVGLPAAIAAKLILNDQLPLSGCYIPIEPVIYTKVIEELKKEGIDFKERVETRE
ncbi:MAG: saccharopine dehydrogenase C-terminal domain-containing protein [bacterium]